MELIARSENAKDPVKTARSNFFALGFLYVILAVLFFQTAPRPAYLLAFLALLVFIIAYFLSKRKMIGVYLGWLYVAVGIVSLFVTLNLLSLVVILYLGYWNYKAQQSLKPAAIN